MLAGSLRLMWSLHQNSIKSNNIYLWIFSSRFSNLQRVGFQQSTAIHNASQSAFVFKALASMIAA
jgi:hypothetical protein